MENLFVRMLKLIQKSKAAKGCFLAAALAGVCVAEGIASATPSITLFQSPTTAKSQGEATKPQGDEKPQSEAETASPSPPRGSGAVVPGPPAKQSQQRQSEGQQPAKPPQGQQRPPTRPPTPRDQPQAPAGGVTPDQQDQKPAQRPPSGRRGRQGPLSLKFDEQPIRDVVEIVMEELGFSYVIDPQVTGTVSINMRGGVPREQVFPILEQLLQMNGFAIVRQAENFYAIVPLAASPKLPQKMLLNPGLLEKPQPEEGKKEKEAKEKPQGEQKKEGQGQSAPPSQPPAGGAAARAALPGAPPAPLTPQQQQQPQPPEQIPHSLLSPESAQIEGEEGVITYIIPLNFIPTSEFLKMAQVYMSDGATVVDFAPSNILMITDFRRNIQQVLNLVDLLDTRYFDINDIALIPIRYNNAADVAEDLGKIFAPNDTAAGVRIVAIERINAILAVTHGPNVLMEVRKWIDKLDSTSSGSNVKTYIYEVENNTADQIATILEQLYQDGFGLPSSAGGQDARQDTQQGQQQPPRRQQQAGFVPESQAERRRGVGGIGGQQPGSLGPSLSQRPDAASGIRAVVSGNVKIIVNEFNNSLIIQATEADYQYLLNTIRQLDVLPRQVVIEAEIYSVLLTDDLSFGVMAFLEGFVNPDTGAPTGPFPATTASSSSGTLTAVTRRMVGNTRQLRVMLQAMSAKTDVKILDAPRIMTMDGIQATINIGAEVPVQTSSFSDPLQGSTGFVNQVSFRPTGTTLLIVPRVSASGIVNLELSLEVSTSSSAGTDETNLTPTINRSFVETTLICRDGQSVAIGGIISENNTLNKNRLPIVGDIPVIGALFGSTRKEFSRTELIFLITPSVVKGLPTAVELTLEFQRALRGSYDFIRKKQGERKELIEGRKAEELKPPGN